MQPDAVIVLGMHRSGTSAITRALKAIGVALGDDLLAPNEYNVKGYWEDRAVVSLNERVLAALGHNWHSLRPIEPSQWESPEINELRTEAAALIQQRFGQFPLWGIKDPRLSRLLNFWQPVFRSMGIEEAYVIAIRNPLSVARSLRARDGFPLEKSFFLWLQHILAALNQTHGKRRVIVDFDEMMTDPLFHLQRVVNELNIPWSMANRESFIPFSEDFFDDALRHARFVPDDIKRDGHAPCLVREVYEYMSQFVQGSTGLDSAELSCQCELFQGRIEPSVPFLRYMDELEARPVPPPMQAQLFIDSGSGISEEESIIEPISADTSRLVFNLDGNNPIRLRFDPVNTYVTMQLPNIILAYSDSSEFQVTEYVSNGMRDGGNLRFDSEDPQIYFDVPNDKPISQCRIEVSYRLLGYESLADTLKISLNQTAVLINEAHLEITKRTREATNQAGTIVHQAEIINTQVGKISLQEARILQQAGKISEQDGIISEQIEIIGRKTLEAHELKINLTVREEQLSGFLDSVAPMVVFRHVLKKFSFLYPLRAVAYLKAAGLIIRSGLFDYIFYINQNPDVVGSGIHPLVHFLEFGASEFRDPNPLFDISYYLHTNPDAASSKINPLVHYLKHGARAMLDPHPLFDTSYYIESNADVAGSGINPLVHFIRHGGFEGRNPHPLFDTSSYLESNPDVARAGVNPLVHFIQCGWKPQSSLRPV